MKHQEDILLCYYSIIKDYNYTRTVTKNCPFSVSNIMVDGWDGGNHEGNKSIMPKVHKRLQESRL